MRTYVYTHSGRHHPRKIAYIRENEPTREKDDDDDCVELRQRRLRQDIFSSSLQFAVISPNQSWMGVRFHSMAPEIATNFKVGM